MSVLGVPERPKPMTEIDRNLAEKRFNTSMTQSSRSLASEQGVSAAQAWAKQGETDRALGNGAGPDHAGILLEKVAGSVGDGEKWAFTI